MIVRSVTVIKGSAESVEGLPAHLVPVWTRSWYRELISELWRGRSSPVWKVQPVQFHVVDFSCRNKDGTLQFETEQAEWVERSAMTSLTTMSGDKSWVDMLAGVPPHFGIAASADLQKSASALNKVSCLRGPSLRISGKDVLTALNTAAFDYPEENEPKLIGWNGETEIPLRFPVEFKEIGQRHIIEAAKTLTDLSTMDAICLDTRQLFFRLF